MSFSCSSMFCVLLFSIADVKDQSHFLVHGIECSDECGAPSCVETENSSQNRLYVPAAVCEHVVGYAAREFKKQQACNKAYMDALT